MNFDKVLGTTKITGYDFEKKTYPKNTKRYLMLHHTGSINYDFNCKYLSGNYITGARNVSVHYVVGVSGAVCKIGEHDMVLWHVGTGKDPKDSKGVTKDMNPYCIGIEICCDDKGEGYTDKQRASVSSLVKYICEKENISPDRVIRHADTSGIRGKWDVSPAFYKPWGTFQNYVASIFKTPEPPKDAEIESAKNNAVASIKTLWGILDLKGKGHTEKDKAHSAANLIRSI